MIRQVDTGVHNRRKTRLFDRGQHPQRFMPPGSQSIHRFDVFLLSVTRFIRTRSVVERLLHADVGLDLTLCRLQANHTGNVAGGIDLYHLRSVMSNLSCEIKYIIVGIVALRRIEAGGDGCWNSQVRLLILHLRFIENLWELGSYVGCGWGHGEFIDYS